MRADGDEETGVAEEEFENGRSLYQNYVKKKDENPRKAGEHLWGAINNQLSALSRLSTGTGLGKHEKVREFALDWISLKDELSDDTFEAAENLHRNFYHDFLDGREWQRDAERALRLYDLLETEVSEALYSEGSPTSE